jgi:phosphate transport system substrate-binding protein
MTTLRACLVMTLGLVCVLGETSQGKVVLNGAGATFPYPIYSKWFAEFEKLHPETIFNYQSIGSGGGIRQLLDETVDFGASDAPMKDAQLQSAKQPIFHFPTVIGAVVITYNIGDSAHELKLTGQQVADIFLGKIRKWDDPSLLKLNPWLLPTQAGKDILVVHRSDGSGTTAVFSDYLAKISPEWKAKVGQGSALRWPMGIGGKGNEGVASFVKSLPGSIAYTELVFSKQLKLPVASLESKQGEFVEPSVESVSRAAEVLADHIPADFRISLTAVSGKGVYPISSFTYFLIYERMPIEKRDGIVSLFKWIYGEGQKIAARMDYAPISPKLVARILKQAEALRGSKESP